MAIRVIWNGTTEESADLVNAIARNCLCDFGPDGVRGETCAGHKMLLGDQRALDGLLWERRLRACREREEGLEPEP